MRKGLIVLLSFGVVAGFGSGFARLAHRGAGGCHDRWSDRGYDNRYDGYGRYDRYDRYDRFAPPAVAAPAPAAPAAAPVYIVVPSAPAAAPVIVNNAPAQVAPAPAPPAAQ